MMTALKKELSDDLQGEMRRLGAAARAAAAELALTPGTSRDAALKAAAAALRADAATLMTANALDLAAAREAGIGGAMLDRLTLDDARIEGMAAGLDEIAAQPDPVGAVMAEWTRPNGLRIARVRVPLGVIGIIFESRPNVTADAGALCLKSGNAAILRGGSDSFHSSRAIMDCLRHGLKIAGLPAAALQLVPTRDRAAVGEMLVMDRYIDVIIPRGGKSLIARVQEESRIPVLAHREGLCHTYVHAAANADMARAIIVNAKMRRPGICGATETLLVDRAIVATHLPGIIEDLAAQGCELRGDAACRAVDDRVKTATPADWDTEYLEAILSIAAVDDLDAAIAHVNRHGSQHTDAIVTDDDAAAAHFLARVDSAIVMHNASTQYADGGEFGMGAEIGISTGRLHARGPVGAEQLTIYKYVVHGDGQVRP